MLETATILNVGKHEHDVAMSNEDEIKQNKAATTFDRLPSEEEKTR